MSTILFDSIKTASKITDSVLVGFSGGKESVVVLDLCCRYFKKVQPYLQYIVPNSSWDEKIINWYENRYGVEFIRVPVEDLGAMFRYGEYTAPDPYFPIVSETDVINYCRQQTGIYWCCTGERIDDSIERRGRIKRHGTIDAEHGRIFPVALWKKREIYDYIKYKKLFLAKEQMILGHSIRVFSYKDLQYIYDHYPDDYQKIMRLFPFAGAILKRNGVINGKKQVSGVRHGDDQS